MRSVPPPGEAIVPTAWLSVWVQGLHAPGVRRIAGEEEHQFVVDMDHHHEPHHQQQSEGVSQPALQLLSHLRT